MMNDIKIYLSITREKLMLLLVVLLVTTIFPLDVYAINESIKSGSNSVPVVRDASRKKIVGVVRDSNGESVIGATVSVPETTTGTITNIDGNYSIEVPTNAVSLKFSYVGMKTKTEAIKGRTTINIVLENAAVGLDEIMVVGYGTQKKASITGAISSVDSKKLLQSPQANISNALVGRLPGLTAVQKSGEPGKDQSIIRIRGIGTFAAGYDSDLQNPLVMVDGIEDNSWNNINPNDIDNVAVLKDASATAVYGVRGANGVILITTKRGQLDKPRVSFTTNTAVSSFTNMRQNMNSYDYARSFNEARSYDAYTLGAPYVPVYTDNEVNKFKDGSDPVFYPNSDWVDMIFKKQSVQTNHNINVRGGTERVKYFVSLGAFTQGGLYNYTKIESGGKAEIDTQVKYSRYNFRTNFDFDVTNDFKISLQTSNQMDFRNHPQYEATKIFSDAYNSPPVSGPGIYDGKIIQNVLGRYSLIKNPPLNNFSQANGLLKDYQNQLQTSVKATYDLSKLITKGLNVHGLISYQNYSFSRKRITRDISQWRAERDPNDLNNPIPLIVPASDIADGNVHTLGTSDNSKSRRTYMEWGADYSRQFHDHNIGGLVLYNQTKYNYPAADPNFKIPFSYQGVVGRVTYSYANKYLAEFDMGYNGSENFAKGKRFGFFPAYSAGWVLTEEKFIPKNEIVTFVKIRGSYGEVGNDKVGGDRFMYLPTRYYNNLQTDVGSSYNNPIPSYLFGTIPGSIQQVANTASEGSLGNPDLTWERAKKMNIGVDINLFNDKVKIVADYFYEKRTDILTTRSIIPNITGATFPAYNLGIMQNSGYDGEINYRDKVGDFSYWLKGIFSFSRNKILYQEEITRQYSYLQGTGLPFQQYFGLIAEGFYNTWAEVNDINRPISTWNSNKLQPGDVKYRDVNGDGIIDANDLVPIGYTPFPEITYGFSFGGNFKGFDLSVLFQGSGNSSYALPANFQRGFQQDGSAIDYIKDWSWTNERYMNGEQIELPRTSAAGSLAHNYQSSTLWIKNVKYLRLKNAEIGYTFDGSLLKKLGLSSARLYANGTNLLTWTNLWPGLDPEMPSGTSTEYPVVRTYNMGLNINF